MPITIDVGHQLSYTGGYRVNGVVSEIGNICQEVVEFDEDGWGMPCNRTSKPGGAPACGHANYAGYAKGEATQGGEFTVTFSEPL